MKNPPEPQDAKDDLRTLLDETMSAFVIAKRRYLLVSAAVKELVRVEQFVADHSVRVPKMANDAILQMLRDSFDMLVIDLASIRGGMIKQGGTAQHAQGFVPDETSPM